MVESLISEANTSLQSLKRQWLASKGSADLVTLLRAYVRAGKNWIDDRYDEDIANLEKLLHRRKWFISDLVGRPTTL